MPAATPIVPTQVSTDGMRLGLGLVLVVLTACGSVEATATPPAEVRKRLLVIADEAAETSAGRAARVEVVESTCAAANAAIGAGVSGDEAVWVMQIEADPGKPGRYIFSVLRQSDHGNTDGGMS